MTRLLKFTLSLTLGLVPAASFAQELNWRATGPAVMISRPVPLSTGTGWAPAVRSIVRGQSTEDSRPLPPGPLSFNPLAPADIKRAPMSSYTVAQPTTPPVMPKADGFVPPSPQLTMPPANGKATPNTWGGPSSSDRLLGINGECGNPCGAPGCDACSSGCCGWLGRMHLFGNHSDLCGAPCVNMCNDPCCINRPRIWVYTDYLLWGQKNQSFPPLVTTSPAGVPLVDANGAPLAGVLGQPGTTTAFDRFNNPMLSGFRVGGGMWFRQNGCWGMDASYWFLGSTSRTYTLAGDPNTQVFRPINSVVGAPGGGGVVGPTVELVSVPGVVNGSVSVHETQQIWGLDANLRRRLWCCQTGWLDLLMGFRHFTLNESLTISENLTPLGAGGVPLGTVLVTDRFATSNNYNAPQIGIAGQWYFAPRWSLWGSARVAAGINNQMVNVSGSTNFLGVPYNSGILAAPSNIGSRSKDRFAAMTELNMKLMYDITRSLSVYAGYDFLYISSVVRPGSQIDTNVNLTQIPPNLPANLVGPANPAPLFRGESFWLQGVNFGLMYRY